MRLGEVTQKEGVKMERTEDLEQKALEHLNI